MMDKGASSRRETLSTHPPRFKDRTERWANGGIARSDMDNSRFYSYIRQDSGLEPQPEVCRGTTDDVVAFGYLERGRPACGARRTVRLGPRQEGGARPDDVQQVEADHAGGPAALALDRV